jgi:hypothetical protein
MVGTYRPRMRKMHYFSINSDYILVEKFVPPPALF